MKPTKKAQVLAPLLACLLVPALGAAATTGCKTPDEPPPPLPSAAPTPTPTPTPTPVELAPEPIPEPSASATAPKTGTGSGTSLKKCCAALRQNAASAPEPNKTYMLNAATACDMGASIGALGGLLKTAGMPAACK